MAEEKKEGARAEAAEAIKSSGRNFFKLLTWIVPAIILGYVLYMLFIGSDPRRKYDGPRETLEAYSTIVADFMSPAPIWPDKYMVDRVVEFYDGGTRKWFEENKETLARLWMQNQEDSFESLSQDGVRAAAFLYLVNTPPLNGVAEIVALRNTSPTRAEMQVITRNLKPHNLVMEESGGVWYITNVGDAKESLDQRIETFRRNNPEVAETP